MTHTRQNKKIHVKIYYHIFESLLAGRLGSRIGGWGEGRGGGGGGLVYARFGNTMYSHSPNFEGARYNYGGTWTNVSYFLGLFAKILKIECDVLQELFFGKNSCQSHVNSNDHQLNLSMKKANNSIVDCNKNYCETLPPVFRIGREDPKNTELNFNLINL